MRVTSSGAGCWPIILVEAQRSNMEMCGLDISQEKKINQDAIMQCVPGNHIKYYEAPKKANDFCSHLQVRGCSWHSSFWKALSPTLLSRSVFSYTMSRDYPLVLRMWKPLNYQPHAPGGSHVPSTVQSLITCDWPYPHACSAIQNVFQLKKPTCLPILLKISAFLYEPNFPNIWNPSVLIAANFP